MGGKRTLGSRRRAAGSAFKLPDANPLRRRTEHLVSGFATKMVQMQISTKIEWLIKVRQLMAGDK
jgi:hypothetical protein